MAAEQEQQDVTLARIRQYTQDAQNLQADAMDFDASDTAARLDQTVKELQARVQEQQAALEKLKQDSAATLESAAYVSEDPRKRLQQLHAVRDAYRQLKPTPTYLPAQESALPALLALRTITQDVQGTKVAISSTQRQIKQAEAAARREEAHLHDANLLTQAMENRIRRLRAQHEDRSQKTPAQLARELIATKSAQKDRCDEKMQQLGEAMNNFINDYLAAMIAAEELGGPVVGDMLDVGDDTLAAGFTKKGRAKSTKNPVKEKTRQRRIDQIWGTQTVPEDIGEEEEPLTEAESADAEMRRLIENLFATLSGPGGGKAYFQLERDSAASRFLVRAKIAQFHPKDARKLRLIDFGRELDD